MLEFQKGDQASFETLMRKYYARVLNFIYRFINNRDTAEDITQEVFVKVYKSAPTYKPRSKFQTWVFTMAKNASLNELRRLKHQGYSLDKTMEDDEGGIMMRQMEDPTQLGPAAKMIRDERVAVIREAIHALPENQRIAVLLRRYENLSYEEIAQTMGTSVEAVKSLLSRAKENLRNKLISINKNI
jgi:RNA polymerase sigma-70 factor (ECF subfamily)